MHIPPRTGDRGFKENGVGLLVVLRCNCVTSVLYVSISLLVDIV